MEMLHLINMVASFTVVAGIIWATHSKHVCDGVLIKIGLAALAFGCAANGIKPTFHAQLWMVCSLAAIILFFFARLAEAKIRGVRPVFLVLNR